MTFIVTCEHARNGVPPGLRRLFRGEARLLAGHEGYDRGALDYARRLARALGAPLIAGEVSRLVVDLNRSPHHPALYSTFTRGLPQTQRREILRRYYFPYRLSVGAEIERHASRGEPVCHFSCHSFTPVRNGVRRHADIALLYDPARSRERAGCEALRMALAGTGLRVRRNYPFRGVADGLTTSLRRRFPDAAYAGIEIEINQSLFQVGWTKRRRELVRRLAEAARFFALRAATQAGPAGSCPPERGRRQRPFA
jgi:predicted N-formylglutamate amidohydrolase